MGEGGVAVAEKGSRGVRVIWWTLSPGVRGQQCSSAEVVQQCREGHPPETLAS